jgi:hypothetical protein
MFHLTGVHNEISGNNMKDDNSDNELKNGVEIIDFRLTWLRQGWYPNGCYISGLM